MRERSLEAQKYHELCVDLLPKMASLAWVAHFCDFPPINLHKRQMSMTLIIMSGWGKPQVLKLKTCSFFQEIIFLQKFKNKLIQVLKEFSSSFWFLFFPNHRFLVDTNMEPQYKRGILIFLPAIFEKVSMKSFTLMTKVRKWMKYFLKAEIRNWTECIFIKNFNQTWFAHVRLWLPCSAFTLSGLQDDFHSWFSY